MSHVAPELVSWVEEAFVAKVEEAIKENGVIALSHRAVEVALAKIPLYVVEVNGHAKESLLLNVVQSVDERHPF